MKRALAAIAISVWAGCGGGPANIHDTYRAAAQAFCEAQFRCCSAAQAMARTGVADAAHCSMSVNGGFNATAAIIQTAIDKGLYTFSSGAAALCLDGIRGGLASCDGSSFQTDLAGNPICASVVAGTVKPGAHCNSADYGGGCQPGSFCTIGQTCQLYANSGESCAATQCGPGLVCLSTTRCGPPLDDGQRCTGAAQCKSKLCTGGSCAPTPTVAQTICM